MNAKQLAASTIAIWIGKLGALLSLLFLGWFAIAHIIEGGPSPTANEWIGLAFFPIGMMLGLGVSLKNPLAGGGLVLLFLASFYGWHFLESGRAPSGPFFVLLAAPGIFLLCVSLVLKRGRGANVTAT